MFTPVINFVLEKFKTLFLSTIIGETTSLLWLYSMIASKPSDVTNQYTHSVLSYLITPIVLAAPVPVFNIPKESKLALPALYVV